MKPADAKTKRMSTKTITNEHTIYKKDTSGKIRYLKTWTDGDILHQESGVVGGAPVPHQKVCTPKNVGRSNETTGQEQANLELQSLLAEKLKGGYFNTQAEAEGGNVILPMLAKSYKDEAKKVEWPALSQPKLDGMRALGDKSLISREGTKIETLPHISKLIAEIPFHLDGELYAHGLNFQENMRLIKKYREGETEKVKYHVYDVVSSEPFSKRYLNFIKWFNENKAKYSHIIEVVGFSLIKDLKDLKVEHATNLGQGYEGTMIRWGNEPYKVGGRSSNLLKYKDFLDIALPIKAIEPAKDRPTWAVPVFEYKGKEFRAGMKFSHAEREEMLKNKEKYIGKIAELRFFEWTEDEIPRFPVVVGIRLDKKKGDK